MFWLRFFWIVKEGRICRAGLHLLKCTLTIILGSSLRDCMVTLYNSIWPLECSVSSGLRSISTAHNLSKEKLSNGWFFRRVLRPRLQFLFIFGDKGFFMRFDKKEKPPSNCHGPCSTCGSSDFPRTWISDYTFNRKHRVGCHSDMNCYIELHRW